MLLSSVGETVYWTARYIERAENMARIVMAHSNLLLDLPKSLDVGWQPLLAIFGCLDEFNANHKEANERNIVRFLLTDKRNSGSLLSALAFAHENMRVTRTSIPREIWETLNDLNINSKENANAGLTRRGRYYYLQHIINTIQQIYGSMNGTLSHDEVYAFMLMGINIERADMTTRVLDVRSTTLLNSNNEGVLPFADIQWMSVLKCLGAYQMYRRNVHVRVSGNAVLAYLLQDIRFPRALPHCLNEVDNCLKTLPRNEAPLRTLGRAQRMVRQANVSALAVSGLHEFIDELQEVLGELHGYVATTYFSVEESSLSSLVSDAT